MVELGDRVKDKITGLKGIVVSVSQFLYGCTRVGIQPEEAKDGKPAESFYIDEPQCEVIKKEAVTPGAAVKEPNPIKRAHGPRQDVMRAKDIRR